MLSKAMQDALNAQIKEELYSAYLYLSMAAYCETLNLPGFAHWMQEQYKEETAHAFKFYGYIHDRGGRVALEAIDKPPAEFGFPMKVFQETLEHEKKITGLINKLVALAIKEGDYATQEMLMWFVKEQVEEEKVATTIIEQLRMLGDKPSAGLIMLDRHLASRGK